MHHRGLVLIASICAAVLHAAAQDAPLPQETGQIRVTTRPEGAMVYRNGVLEDSSPVSIMDVGAGTHLITATKDGYHDARATVKLLKDQKVGIDLVLDPMTGLLLIHSEPEGAEIEIEGAARGQTPLLITDLPFGRYRLRAKSLGYLPKEVDLTLQNRIPQKVEIDLTSNSATLELDSEPSGAEVLLNGIPRGHTPCLVERIQSGDGTLELRLDGFHTHSQDMRFGPGQRESITVKLDPIPAKLSIVTIPTGARIYVNNQFRGESPVDLADLPPGGYRLRAELRGHISMARTVELVQAQEVTEEFRMVRNCGVLAVTTQPAGVEVFVDGEAVGTTDSGTNRTDRISEVLRVDLVPIGTHLLLLSKPGYFERKREITVEKDKTLSVDEVMRRRFIPNFEVRTDDDVIRGVLVEIDPLGNVKLEVRPGIFKTVPGTDVRLRRPLRTENQNIP